MVRDRITTQKKNVTQFKCNKLETVTQPLRDFKHEIESRAHSHNSE